MQRRRWRRDSQKGDSRRDICSHNWLAYKYISLLFVEDTKVSARIFAAKTSFIEGKSCYVNQACKYAQVNIVEHLTVFVHSTDCNKYEFLSPRTNMNWKLKSGFQLIAVCTARRLYNWYTHVEGLHSAMWWFCTPFAFLSTANKAKGTLNILKRLSPLLPII